uniref:Protein kinase domain-containing protein n=1 Tax=Hanusia phi TaxID=3032 RepID=A0A7S0ESX0_9CRYP|mmetsp:Transcript_28788/g.65239  ORF Transcript_28788/g.65239 Transcript_28788/m.65239 type:complete len:436 (+) Transcript_28788:1-1308(+)
MRTRREAREERERRRMRLEEVAAALLVSNLRVFLARRRRRHLVRAEREEQELGASLLLQKTFRGHVGRRMFEEQREEVRRRRKGRAAGEIQRVWRGGRERRRARGEEGRESLLGLFLERFWFQGVEMPQLELKLAYEQTRGGGREARTARLVKLKQLHHEMCLQHSSILARDLSGSSPPPRVLIRLYRHRLELDRITAILVVLTRRSRRAVPVAPLLLGAPDVPILREDGSTVMLHVLVVPAFEETMRAAVSRIRVKGGEESKAEEEDAEEAERSRRMRRKEQQEELIALIFVVASCLEFLHDNKIVLGRVQADSWGWNQGRWLLFDLEVAHKEGELLDRRAWELLDFRVPELYIARERRELSGVRAHRSQDVFLAGALFYEFLVGRCLEGQDASGEECDAIMSYILTNCLTTSASDRFSSKDILRALELRASAL